MLLMHREGRIIRQIDFLQIIQSFILYSIFSNHRKKYYIPS